MKNLPLFVSLSFALGRCPCPNPNCTALYLESLGRGDRVLCLTEIPLEAMPKLIEIMQDHMYAVKAMEDEHE